MRYSKEDKAKLLADWRQSGKSISAYVKEHGLVRWTFTKWLKAERRPESCFVEIRASEQPFVREKELVIEKGEIRIHTPLSITHDELRMIVGVLGGAA